MDYRAFCMNERIMCEVLLIDFEEKKVVLRANNSLRYHKEFHEVTLMRFTGMFDNTQWEDLSDKGNSLITRYAYDAARYNEGIQHPSDLDAKNWWRGIPIYERDLILFDEDESPYLIESSMELIRDFGTLSDYLRVVGNEFER